MEDTRPTLFIDLVKDFESGFLVFDLYLSALDIRSTLSPERVLD